jgi:hypothetical protein
MYVFNLVCSSLTEKFLFVYSDNMLNDFEFDYLGEIEYMIEKI